MRALACPARPTTESRPVCHEPRRWWAMHSLRRPNSRRQSRSGHPGPQRILTRGHMSPTDGALQPCIFRYLCLSTLLTRYMNVPTGYDKILIPPGGPPSGGVRPPPCDSGPRQPLPRKPPLPRGLRLITLETLETNAHPPEACCSRLRPGNVYFWYVLIKILAVRPRHIKVRPIPERSIIGDHSLCRWLSGSASRSQAERLKLLE